MDDLRVMSAQEIHEFGIRVVADSIQNLGFAIEEIFTDISINPQIIAKQKRNLIFILVRTESFPKKGVIRNKNFINQFQKYSERMGAKSFFASVGVCNAYGITDLEKSSLYKNGKFHIDFQGLIELSELLNMNLGSDTMFFYNEKGSISGSVIRQPDGRHVIQAGENSGFNAAIMSLFVVFADDLSENEKLVFSEWAELPNNIWEEQHRKEFAFALMHYFMECKSKGIKLSLEIDNVIKLLKLQQLPPLRKPLSSKVKKIFRGLFIA